jgi:hypothetical protein
MQPGPSNQSAPDSPSLADVSLHPPGLLVPDIPLEETSDIRQVCAKYGLELVLLTTPTTPKVCVRVCMCMCMCMCA